MTAPGATAAAWPGLGFDPAPGDPAAVRRLAGELEATARGLQESRAAFETLRTPGRSWTGTAADTFGARSPELPGYLDAGHASLGRAVPALTGWAGTLDAHRARARELEAAAVRLREQVRAAEDAEQRAARHPDLGLAGQTFDDEESLADATRRLDTAERALTAARTRIGELDAALGDVLRDATHLLNRHETDAAEVARTLDRAGDGVPPPDPEWYAAGGGAGEALNTVGDVAGVVSAAAGALALIPLFTPIAGPVALISGGVALAAHAVSMGQSGRWNGVTLAGDVAGLVPGVGAIKKVGETVSVAHDAAKAARAVGDGAAAASARSDGASTAGRLVWDDLTKHADDAPVVLPTVNAATGLAAQAPTVKDWVAPPGGVTEVDKDSASTLGLAGNVGRILTAKG